MIQKYSISDKVVALTSDNASNNSAFDLIRFSDKFDLDQNFTCGFIHFRCVAHVINLGVREALKKLKSTLEDTRVIVRLLKSNKKTENFNRIQRELFEKSREFSQSSKCKELLAVIDEVDTRWNSPYLMIERILRLREAIKEAKRQLSTLIASMSQIGS